MEKENISINMLCYNFSKELVDLINKYGQYLPSSVVYLIIKDIYKDIKSANDNALLQELNNKEETITKEIPVNFIDDKKEEENK